MLQCPHPPPPAVMTLFLDYAEQDLLLGARNGQWRRGCGYGWGWWTWLGVVRLQRHHHGRRAPRCSLPRAQPPPAPLPPARWAPADAAGMMRLGWRSGGRERQPLGAGLPSTRAPAGCAWAPRPTSLLRPWWLDAFFVCFTKNATSESVAGTTKGASLARTRPGPLPLTAGRHATPFSSRPAAAAALVLCSAQAFAASALPATSIGAALPSPMFPCTACHCTFCCKQAPCTAPACSIKTFHHMKCYMLFEIIGLQQELCEHGGPRCLAARV